MGEEIFIVPRFAINASLEDRNHGLVGLLVKVVDLVALVEQVGNNVRRRVIDDGRRHNVGHVPRVLMLR